MPVLLLRQPSGIPPTPPPTPIRPTSTLPRVAAEIAFATWDDVFPYLRSFSFSRGRTRERERMGAGTGTMVLDNRDGTFDRDNPGSPFYGNIRPGRPTRLSVRIDTGVGPFIMGRSPLGAFDALGGGAQSITLFTGRTEGGPMTFVQGADSYVTWSMVDASKRLNRDRSATGYGSSSVSTGERVEEVLLGTTPTWQDGTVIDAGTRTIQQETGVLGRFDYLLQVAESEGGFFFIDAYGRAVFHDADYAAEVDAIPFGDASDEQPYKDITFEDDDKEIYNAVTVTASGLEDQTAEDIESEAEHGRIDLSISTLLAGESEMLDLATSVVATYSQPQRRIGQLTIGTRYTDWYRVLSKEIGDRVKVRHRPIYGGLIEQDLVIQGISIRSPSKFEWGVTWNLAPPLAIVSNPNLLTANQTSMETDTSGWVVDTGYAYIEGLVAGEVPYLGSYCLEVKSYDFNPPGEIVTTPYDTASVVAGQMYRASAYVRSYFSSLVASVYIDWLDAGGSQLSQSSGGEMDTVDPVTTEWVHGTSEGVAPSGAVYGRVRIRLAEVGELGRPMYVDAVTLRHVGA